MLWFFGLDPRQILSRTDQTRFASFHSSLGDSCSSKKNVDFMFFLPPGTSCQRAFSMTKAQSSNIPNSKVVITFARKKHCIQLVSSKKTWGENIAEEETQSDDVAKEKERTELSDEISILPKSFYRF